MAVRPSASRTAFTLVELLVVISIIGVMVGLLLPAVQAAREAARRMQCSNNMRQIGLALHNYESTHKRFPAGWVANHPDGHPGWGWAVALLPFIEQGGVQDRLDPRLKITAAPNQPMIMQVVPTFICPSDPFAPTFEIGEAEGHDDHDDHEWEGEDHGHEPHNVDEGQKLFSIARGNYVAVYGTTEVDQSPYAGNGAFFGNSRIRIRDFTDGTSNTMVIGERGSRLGGSLWHGVIPEANAAFSRIVGSTDHTPNSLTAHFDDFGSYHATGAHFVMADNSIRLVPSTIDLSVYQAMATRQGGEAVRSLD